VDVERAADQRFDALGIGPLEAGTNLDNLSRAIAVLVVGNPPVGFCALEELDGQGHVEGLYVIPESGRRGLGRDLLEAACEAARAEGFTRVTLVTFADVPFNAPFYLRASFRVARDDELGDELRAIVEGEVASGLAALGRRVALVRALSPGEG
jgi:GNAT superfamily N-acetyltransferase